MPSTTYQPMSTHEERDGRVEHPRRPRRPGLDLAPSDVAPEEVGDDADHDEEREAQQRRGGHERRLLVQEHDRERDDREDREVPDERAHAVM